VFERYAIVSQTDIAEAMQKLEAQRAGHSLGIAQSTEAESSEGGDSAKRMTQ
jgi:hypothetical protein